MITHKELVKIAYRYVLKNCSVGIAFCELVSVNAEIADVIGFGSWGHSVLIECKISRSDFLCDKNKPFRKNPALGMGKQRFYCCPAGLIKVHELPKGWGLIYVYDKGKTKCVHSPYSGNISERHTGFEKNNEAEQNLMYSALRRLFIKGVISLIYDKQYNRSTTAKQLIELNEHADTTAKDEH